MNHAYRLVWSHVQNRLIVAAEISTGRGKNGSKSAATLPMTLLGCLALAASVSIPTLALAAPPAAGQLPVGGQVVAGTASISQQAARMDIHQQSNKAIINWQGFDIGSQAQVNFNQPSSSSVALNRVLSSNPSQIYGQLNANGQVYLVNPNGILFGKGSQVNVGGLIASSLDITNQDFLDGKRTFTRGNAKGGILNQGSIKAHKGGSIALIAPKVVNEGIVTAQMGNVVLASGNKVTLSDGANGLIQVAVEPSTIDSLIENKALIKADGGQVIMTASAAGTLQGGIVNNSGTVQAKSLQRRNGRILLLGDMQHGQTQAAGKLSAKFVETSAAKVVLDKDLKVDTQGGEWLIDPVDITIDSTKASAIQTGLNSGNVTVTTANSATNLWGSNGTGTDPGNIHVNAAINWNQNSLTLTADNDININTVMTASGSSKLMMNTGSAGTINVARTDTGFTGRVDFPDRSGTGFLTINGNNYTVINSLGAEGSTNGTDLQGMNGNLSGYYALGSNIDASATSTWNSGKGFVPIGQSTTPFTGQFDGLGHSISGLSINRPGEHYQGLFGRTNGAGIRNIGLESLSIKGKYYVGGLVGFNYISSSISNSSASGNVTGEERVGGLVGYNHYSSISNSSASDRVIGGNRVGGLVGYNYHSSISDSSASGRVDGNEDVGGLVGWNNKNSSISNSSASGSVTGGSRVGGLVGYNYDNSSISNSSASGSMTGNSKVGGLVGGNHNSSISDSSASGDVEGNDSVGGLVGYNYGYSSSISGSSASGSVTGVDFVGGLVGWSYNSSISDSTANGSVTGWNRVGGLVGYNYDNSSISDSTASGSVEGDDAVGGLVGWNDSSNISDSIASGSVTSRNRVGGLVGWSYNSSISSSTASGSVIGNGVFVGGLVGVSYSSSISGSYASGSVTGTAGVGGLVGGNNNSSISSSFWDTETTGQTKGCGEGDCSGATGKTTAQMKSLATFSGWDIDDAGGTGKTWRIYEGDSYPLLRAFLTPLAITSVNDDSKTYDGTAYSGGNGYTAPGAAPSLIFYGGAAQGAKNIGTYAISLYSNQQGYDLIGNPKGTLTIAAAPQIEPPTLSVGSPAPPVDPPAPPVDPPVPPVGPPASPMEPPSAGGIYRDTTQTSGNLAGMGRPHDPSGLMANYTASLQPIGEGNGFPGMGSAFVTLAPGYVPFAPGAEEVAIAVGDPPAANTAAEDNAVDGDGGERAKRRRGRR